jgi:hypothetical protein
MSVITQKSNMPQIIEGILTHIFKHEMRRHQQCVDAIALKGGVSYTTFLHQGVTFRPSNATSARRASLPEHCWDDIDLHIKDKEAVDWDSKAFWQMLYNLLHSCSSWQEVRDALPDFIVEMVPNIKDLPRQDQEAWTLTDERTKRQWAKVREKMEFYVTIQKHPEMAKLVSLYHFEA